MPHRLAVLTLLGLHAGLLAHSAAVHSPSYDEVGHLPAGVVALTAGRFDLYRVNPPLVKAVAALPAVLAGSTADDFQYDASPSVRPEWSVGRRWISDGGEPVLRLFTWGRWACIPFSLMAAGVCYFWARTLWGPPAGLLALALWCCCPNVLGNGAMITPDLGAAACGVLAALLFARWLKDPTPSAAIVGGLALGLAQLAKMTWIILFGLWPLLFAIYRCGITRSTAGPKPPVPSVSQMLLVLGTGWWALNLGYLWDGSLIPLREYTFQSQSLSGRPLGPHGGATPGNRFADSWLGQLPVPLPRDYLIGLDVQKLDFEKKKWSYLCGEHRLGGWWYYYLVALLLKVPLGYWLLGLAALWWSLRRAGPAIPAADRLLLTATPLLLLVVVSSETGFSRYLRYLLPAFPFVYVLMGSAATMFEGEGRRWRTLLISAALVWGATSSLWNVPNSLSYFNEIAGGPRRGYRCLNDANVSWGQDAYFLREWIRAHPEATPLTVAYVSFFDLRVLGINAPRTPTLAPAAALSPAEASRAGPQPGWHIVDVNYLTSRQGEYDYLHRIEPVDWIACSLPVFRLTLDQANELRSELGLPPLPADP